MPEISSSASETDTNTDTDTNSNTSGFTGIEVKNVVQEYPAPADKSRDEDHPSVVRVLNNINLSLTKPGINMILGPSGCGKSTLLRMMGGVRPIGVPTPTKGTVHINGEPCHDAHPDAVMVFQRYANRPDLSVRDNIALPFRFKLWKQRVHKKERQQRVDQMLQAVGLADKASLRPSQLSGGQNQRVALARALVLRPHILLMDEPFGALDAQTREGMQELLVDLWRQHPCYIVFVTHDVTEALLLGDRVIVLSSQPAEIADDFTITEPRPRPNLWLRSTEATQFEERILQRLHAGHIRGQVRVSV